MKNNRRMKRMSRGQNKKTSLNLTSLMDVFTILVFFLLVNSSSTEVLEPPKDIEVPESIVETKPRETVLVMINNDNVLVQGDPVVGIGEVLTTKAAVIEPIKQRLLEQQNRVIGISTQAIAKSKEVTILADKQMPFKLLKKVMSSCTAAGYEKISLAVNQKAPEADGSDAGAAPAPAAPAGQG